MEELIAEGLRRESIKRAQAQQMATLFVSSLEGGVVLSRASDRQNRSNACSTRSIA